jgi:CNT family concentrative nucleoside transporter
MHDNNTILLFQIEQSKKKKQYGYEFAIFMYAIISLRLLAQHVSISHFVYTPLGQAYDASIGKATSKISPLISNIFFGGLFFVVLAICAIATPTSDYGNIGQRFQSIGGIVFFLAILYASSADRKAIKWHTVTVGLVIQLAVGLLILKTEFGVNLFSFLSRLITGFLEQSKAGLIFLFGDLSSVLPGSFGLSVLPAIVFFCSFIAIVYYIGGMQYIVAKFAWVMVRLMDTSGAESVVAAASPFVGQGESALLVQPFVEHMTMSELHATMTSGFATIAGSVLLAYVNFTGNSDATTSALLTSCVMSVPCSLLVSKMRLPEKESSLTKGNVTVPESEEKDSNFLHAAGNGAATGVQLILLISGSLLAIVSLYTCADVFTGWFFDMIDVHNMIDGPTPDGKPVQLTLAFIFSFILWVPAVAIGIAPSEARKAGEFMATKLVVNEFVAYATLNSYVFEFNQTNADGSLVYKKKDDGSYYLSFRTVRLLTFALCGFANFASIGIQIGCLGAMAPSRRGDLARLALSAMLCGTIATWISAAIAGALY